jgi:hypothetical protein
MMYSHQVRGLALLSVESNRPDPRDIIKMIYLHLQSINGVDRPHRQCLKTAIIYYPVTRALPGVGPSQSIVIPILMNQKSAKNRLKIHILRVKS